MDKESVNLAFEECKGKYGINFAAKEEQLEVVSAVLNGNDVLGLLPTGFGKTLCIVMPTMLSKEESITLIVSPLTALMDDQLSKIRGYGLSAAKIEPFEKMDADVLSGLKQGRYQIVLASPEAALKRFWKDIFISKTWQSRVKLLAIDEAHCISEWGDDFRPQYRNLHQLRSFVPCPVMALTATTTSQVKSDIISHLNLSESAVTIAQKPDRPNIFIHIEKSKSLAQNNPLDWLVEHIRMKQSDAKKVVIFCRSVDAVSQTWGNLRRALGDDVFIDGVADSAHILVEMYHKCTDDDSKIRILENFKNKNSTIRCVVATTALGMGIDISDIDMVIHIGSPKSVLSYWQEVGRCARDGRIGYAITLYDNFTLSRPSTAKDIAQILRNKDGKCYRDMLMEVFEGKDLARERRVCESCTEQDVCRCSLCCCCSYCRSQCPCQQVSNYDQKSFLSG